MRRWMRGIAIALACFVALVALAFGWASLQPPSHPRWGATFSPTYARFLGLDPHEAFRAVVADLGAKAIRLPLYWDSIEKAPGQDDWSGTDWYVHAAEQEGVKLTLVIGARVPRWPECHIPAWAQGDADARDRALMAYLQAAVERYKGSPAVERWQVENEPGFTLFGECPSLSHDLLRREVLLVHSLDTRPVQLTTSGEIQPWFPIERLADVLGTSVYRTVWNRYLGYLTYPFPPAFYRLRAIGARLFAGKVIISELQAEPWFPDSGVSKPITDDARLFTADDLKANAKFAEDTGLPEAYFWGVEWWYALKKAGDPRLWNAGKAIFQQNQTAP